MLPLDRNIPGASCSPASSCTIWRFQKILSSSLKSVNFSWRNWACTTGDGPNSGTKSTDPTTDSGDRCSLGLRRRFNSTQIRYLRAPTPRMSSPMQTQQEIREVDKSQEKNRLCQQNNRLCQQINRICQYLSTKIQHQIWTHRKCKTTPSSARTCNKHRTSFSRLYRTTSSFLKVLCHSR